MKNKIKLKKGDEVIVLTGKDKGKTGQVIKIKSGPYSTTTLVPCECAANSGA